MSEYQHDKLMPDCQVGWLMACLLQILHAQCVLCKLLLLQQLQEF